jgi:hypothetical protein
LAACEWGGIFLYKNLFYLSSFKQKFIPMKKFYFVLFVCVCVNYLNAQTLVSTTPENKKVLIEEFTGTGCPNCPSGHTMAENLLTANPGNLFVIAYHPTNSSYTTTDPMRDVYPNPFYTNPFISPSNRYMPSAMVNRRVWNGVERIQSTGSWTSDANVIKNEPSPLNVGTAATYNSSTHMLDVDVEVYFTSTVTDAVTIYAMLMEEGIVYPQSGGSSPYTHHHTFRKSFVSQWGDAISSPTTQGTLKTFSFSFDNTLTNYDMTQCEVIAFVRNGANEEIISGNQSIVDITTGVNSISVDENSVFVFPNDPVNADSRINLNLSKAEKVSYSIINIVGAEVLSGNIGIISAGKHVLIIDNLSKLTKGTYFLKVVIGQSHTSKKLIVE